MSGASRPLTLPPRRRKARYAERLRVNLKPTPKARDLPRLLVIR